MESSRARSSRTEVFCKKGVIRNFAKFTGKHRCQSLCFNKVAVLRPATLLKWRLWRWCFPVNLVKFLRAPFSQNTPRQVLLHWSHPNAIYDYQIYQAPDPQPPVLRFC